MKQFNKRNLSMMMDLYEMTMANGYYAEAANDAYVTFDVFYRRNPDEGGFAIFAGLEQILDYLEDMHFDAEDIAYFRSLHTFDNRFLDWLMDYRFTGDVYAMPEGTIMYPGEPILTVTAPLVEAQLVETAILSEINHQSLIATKTQRIVRSARGRIVSDFGARRAHNMDAAVYGARAAYIGGAASTATVLAGQMFDIPVSGTMAHSWVMYHDSEYEAFKHFATVYPEGSIFLVDTYDVLHSGIPNAIRVAREVLEPMGKRLKGIRLDSGDLAYLSKKARKVLDDAGLNDCIIVASNSLDEYTIRSIIDQGGQIDSFGVGERLITAKSDPVFGAVYKLVAVQKGDAYIPKIKISETVEKITNPGWKQVWRVYDKEGKAVADMLTGREEDPRKQASVPFVDPLKPWKNYTFDDCTFKPLQVKMMEKGKRTCASPSLQEIRAYVQKQLEQEIWESELRFENPHIHYLDMSPAYYRMKMQLLEDSKGQA